MDKFIVRLTIISMTIYMAISLLYAWNGVLISEYDSVFCCSLSSGVLLNVLVYSQGNYHCVYMRGLSANLVATPLLVFLDGYYNLFEDSDSLIITMSVMWFLGVYSTIVLAVEHFMKVKKLIIKKKWSTLS